LTRLALLAAGAAVLPSVIFSNNRVSADGPTIGPRQRDLLAACKGVAKRMGVFRASTNITHYAPDGQIEMTWTMILPPENTIDDATEQLAQQILQQVY